MPYEGVAPRRVFMPQRIPAAIPVRVPCQNSFFDAFYAPTEAYNALFINEIKTGTGKVPVFWDSFGKLAVFSITH